MNTTSPTGTSSSTSTSEASAQRPLSSAHLAQYRDEGYTVMRELIPRELALKLGRFMQEMVEGKHDESLPQKHLQIADPERYRNPRGGYLVFGYQRPSMTNPLFVEVCDHPRLAGAMSQLLGGEVELFTDQALAKPKAITEKQGGCSFYHQDSYYWKIAPELGCNAWIALCDVDKEAIALGIYPGSQKGWELETHETYFDDPALIALHANRKIGRHRIPADRIDMSKDVILPMKPGDAAFFTNYTWHRAEPNYSGQDKYAYAVAYKRKS